MSRLPRLAAFVLVAGLVSVVSMPPAGAAGSHTGITGSGSSWSANAVNQWVADVKNKQDLQVVFTSTGSAQGRKDFANQSTDFGVSDIAYLGHDPQTGQDDTSQGRPYAYLPIVAGGTSFPYHIGNGAAQIKTLRLSGPTLAKIFTNQITNWNDPAIAKDNNNKLNLPNLRITPVVHSEGSGSTAQFTAYLAKMDAGIWGPYNNGSDTSTEYFPRKGSQVAQNGSDGVINFITSAAGNGTIGFDEYSYPLAAGYPVAKVLNQAGYYTAPTQYNDAVALTAAQINNDPKSQDYLTQTLDQVYVNPDPRSYAISSYSYAIIPTGNSTNGEQKTNSDAQRQTIADFLTYAICQGQAEMGPIGYSPLPINLVEAGFTQIAKLQTPTGKVQLSSTPITSCSNPTFDKSDPTKNLLAVIAPQPPACDHEGAGPCTSTTVVNANPAANGSVPGASTAATGASAGSTATGAPTGAATAAATASASTSIDPLTGQTVSAGGANGNSDGSNAQPVAQEVSQTTANPGFDAMLYVLAVVMLLAALVAPVLVGHFLRGRP